MKSKRRKIFYVALSILIAATIWFYVNNKESVTVYVHDVPIEFLNEDTSLADKGLMRISGDEDITVDLKLQMPRNVVYDFDTSAGRMADHPLRSGRERRALQEGHLDPLVGRRQCGRGLHRRHGRDAARNARGARPAG